MQNQPMTLDVGVSMRLKSLQALLHAHPDAALRFVLPDGSPVPPSFHVTEVGRVRKDFIDCGGTIRSTERCVLQLWLGEDDSHRLDVAKLSRILTLANPLLGSSDLAVEVEYDVGVITQFAITMSHVTSEGIVFRLGGKHTACLAPDRCGQPTNAGSCCSNTTACCEAPAKPSAAARANA